MPNKILTIESFLDENLHHARLFSGGLATEPAADFSEAVNGYEEKLLEKMAAVKFDRPIEQLSGDELKSLMGEPDYLDIPNRSQSWYQKNWKEMEAAEVKPRKSKPTVQIVTAAETYDDMMNQVAQLQIELKKAKAERRHGDAKDIKEKISEIMKRIPAAHLKEIGAI
jgi:hypothetical protein